MTNKSKDQSILQPPARYQEWLAFLFEHPSDRGWYFNLYGTDFVASNTELIELITYTCLHCGEDLLYYTEAEINDGLQYIFNNSCSDAVFCFKDDQVPLPQRIAAIHALKYLYKNCFELRCAPVTGHTNGEGNELNHICYMLWDVTPISYWEDHAQKLIFYDAIVDVLEFALTLTNIACLEGALHGLGHMEMYYPERIKAVIQAFIKHNPNSTIIPYARAALTGYIL